MRDRERFVSVVDRCLMYVSSLLKVRRGRREISVRCSLRTWRGLVANSVFYSPYADFDRANCSVQFAYGPDFR